VRIRATGQIVDLIPAVAAAMLAGGTAERISEAEVPGKGRETAALDPLAASRGAKPAKKKAASRR